MDQNEIIAAYMKQAAARDYWETGTKYLSDPNYRAEMGRYKQLNFPEGMSNTFGTGDQARIFNELYGAGITSDMAQFAIDKSQTPLGGWLGLDKQTGSADDLIKKIQKHGPKLQTAHKWYTGLSPDWQKRVDWITNNPWVLPVGALALGGGALALGSLFRGRRSSAQPQQPQFYQPNLPYGYGAQTGQGTYSHNYQPW